MSRSQRILTVVAASAVSLWIGFAVTNEFREAAKSADYSAHAALIQEICKQLDAIPPGEPYPAALSQLELTYSDGGDSKLLSRFEYLPMDTGYTLRTMIGEREFEHSFTRQ